MSAASKSNQLEDHSSNVIANMVSKLDDDKEAEAVDIEKLSLLVEDCLVVEMDKEDSSKTKPIESVS